ncbi:hypothetical protein [Nocardiopsis sp. FR26]|uniref:hypothetical protein n=1 Tax=Nocardiopsis sp. FR26 TaxID=2605987 RepID=UPI00135B79A0|nr:hypothetical protein [Nocardiopsis sp. FR26]
MTDRLDKAPGLVLNDPGLPYTILVFREGATYYEIVNHVYELLTKEERIAWFGPWGLELDGNPWEHLNPNTIVRPEQIKPEHRIPTPMIDAVLALV